MSKQLYYTETKLESMAAVPLGQFQGGDFINGVDYNRLSTIPGPVGATTLPAQGPFSTPVDISMGALDNDGDSKDKDKDSEWGTFTIVALIGGAVVAFYLFAPR